MLFFYFEVGRKVEPLESHGKNALPKLPRSRSTILTGERPANKNKEDVIKSLGNQDDIDIMVDSLQL